MKNYLNFESDIKNLESEIEKLKDPVYDFEAGTEIFVPKGPTLKQLLGL